MRIIFIGTILTILLLTTASSAQTGAAIKTVRQLYYQYNFVDGANLGEKLASQYPDSTKLRTWQILNQARTRRKDAAMIAAEKLRTANPRDWWAQFAYAGALALSDNPEHKSEAIPLLEKLVAFSPKNKDLLKIYADTLLSVGKSKEASSLLEKNSLSTAIHMELLNSKADALFQTGKDADKKAGYDLFAVVRARDSDNVTAHYYPAFYLQSEQKFAESLPLIKRAAELSPHSAVIRGFYWQALSNGQPDKSEAARQSEIENDINNWLISRPNSPEVLLAISEQYQKTGRPILQKKYEMQILKDFADSAEAEKLLFDQVQDARSKLGSKNVFGTPKHRNFLKLLDAFAARPTFHAHRLAANAFRMQFEERQKDASLTKEDWLRIAENWQQYNNSVSRPIHPQIADFFIKRKWFAAAEQIAQHGVAMLQAAFDRRETKDAGEIAVETEAFGSIYKRLGNALIAQNNFAEAEKEMLAAIARSDDDAELYFHLGTALERQNKLDAAETAFIRGLAARDGDDKQQNQTALKGLYQKRVGNLQGYAVYEAEAGEKAREIRRSRVLASRIVAPPLLLPFTLNDLDNKTVASDALRGKIVVVNFWATWCPPCVAEMPDVQQLARKYANDAEVVILTVNVETDLSKPRKMMQTGKYDFRVLIDSGYSQESAVTAFPTTWFVDKNGKIAFQTSDGAHLLEEFSWRIEALKNEQK